MNGDTLANNGSKAALFAKVEWSATANDWFESLSIGERFSSEDLIYSIGLPATGVNSNNAGGAKIRQWSYNKKIERVGFVKASRTESHARMIFIWEKK